jgi:hypothetical protein
MYTDVLELIWPILLVLLGVVSATLFRSWWAVLVVPAALSIGALLYFSTDPIILYNLQGHNGGENQVMLIIALVFLDILTAIGAVIGTPIGRLIEKRLRH